MSIGCHDPLQLAPTPVPASVSILVAVLGSVLGSVLGCGSLRAPGEPLEWVVCTDDGVCTFEVPDRSTGPMPLRAAGCADEWGLAPDRMTLVGDGDRVVLAGRRAHADGQLADAAEAGQVVVLTAPALAATLAAPAGAGCPGLVLVPGAAAVAATGAALGTDARGDLLVFAGDASATRSLVVYDDHGDGGGDSWSPREVVLDPVDTLPAAASESTPVALAARLPGDQTLLVRSPMTRTGGATAAPVLGLETFDTATAAPVRTWAATYADQDWSGLAAVLGGYGRLYAFSVPVRDLPGLPPPSSSSPGRVVLMGAAGLPLALGIDERALAPSGLARSTTDPATNQGASMVLLPLRPASEPPPYPLGGILFVSGSGLADALAAVEDMRRMQVYDPTAGSWTEVGRLPDIRFLATAVLLPDGRVALIGGNDTDLRVYYVDPRRGFQVATGRASLGRARGVSVGALLADGRVLVGGGLLAINSTREPPDLDVLEPPYLGTGRVRPIITAAPASIAYDTPFSLTVAGRGPLPDEIVLMAFGGSVRGNDPNQRLVELVSSGPDEQGNLTVQAPPASWAPPGRYLLFALANRVPSVGVPIRVSDRD